MISTDSPVSARTPGREFLSAPLFGVAVAFTLGILIDRVAQVQTFHSIAAAVVLAAAWVVKRSSPVAVWLLFGAFLSLGAAHHHHQHFDRPSDDISASLTEQGHLLVAVRGTLLEEPVTLPAQRYGSADFLQKERDACSMSLTEAQSATGWVPASGRIRLLVDRATGDPPQPLNGYRTGDLVQVYGKLVPPRTAANPGEEAQARREADHGWRGALLVSDTTTAVARLEQGSTNLTQLLATLKNWATAHIQHHLPTREAPIARALLLGDGLAMERTTWDDYIRTGVVHVLVISGQHLMVLAGFLWLVCFALGISQRRAVILIAGVVMVYALMTGFRPSAVRATIMVLATCGAILQRRPVHRANSLCLAWLVVLVMNPIDLFDLGCRLSFLSVLVLIFGATTWFAKAERSPLDRLIDENRSVLERSARSMARFIAVAYAVNALLFLTTAPLLMAEQHVVAPVTLLLGPIIVFTSSIALVCGFLFLFFGIVPLLNEVLAWLLKLALEGNAAAVHAATRIPGGTVYVASVPSWWLVGYYLIGGAILWRGWSQSRALRWCWLGWVFLGLAWPGGSKPSDELRVTFLAVGHGSCVLLEPTDGRCVLYDAGSLSGPDVVRNSIAPFLWQRGHRRIDEVFVSHADADHFNGLVELSKRFAIGQVSFTPSFATRPTQDVADTLEVLRNLGIGTRTVAAGDRFALADTSLSVLHPPLEGPMGTENERSLVLQIEQYGYTLLLLGDLEKAGTAMLTAQPPLVVDLAQAPHHGSQTAFTPALRQWLKTRGVIVNRGDLFRNAVTQAHTGRPTWDTQTHGAITLRFTPAGLILETYRTGQRELFQR